MTHFCAQTESLVVHSWPPPLGPGLRGWELQCSRESVCSSLHVQAQRGHGQWGNPGCRRLFLNLRYFLVDLLSLRLEATSENMWPSTPVFQTKWQACDYPGVEQRVGTCTLVQAVWVQVQTLPLLADVCPRHGAYGSCVQLLSL